MLYSNNNLNFVVEMEKTWLMEKITIVPTSLT